MPAPVMLLAKHCWPARQSLHAHQQCGRFQLLAGSPQRHPNSAHCSPGIPLSPSCRPAGVTPLLGRPGRPSISGSGRAQMRQGLPWTPRSRVACTLCHLRLSRWVQHAAAVLWCGQGLAGNPVHRAACIGGLRALQQWCEAMLLCVLIFLKNRVVPCVWLLHSRPAQWCNSNKTPSALPGECLPRANALPSQMHDPDGRAASSAHTPCSAAFSPLWHCQACHLQAEWSMTPLCPPLPPHACRPACRGAWPSPFPTTACP